MRNTAPTSSWAGSGRAVWRSWAPLLRGSLCSSEERVCLRTVDESELEGLPDVLDVGELALDGADPAQFTQGRCAVRDRLIHARPAAVRVPGVAGFLVERGGVGTPLSGRVALVTGGARGLGAAVGQGLAMRGCRVVLADRDVVAAQEVAENIGCGTHPGMATAVDLDVTDQSAWRAVMDEVLEAYGGLDLLLSNAGVVRAGGVTELSADDFDLVTRVNYGGYFLGVQAVAPIMAAQHRANPHLWTDIVEINSKSGLRGSSRNAAYAGSKFAGVGLTQSFALELAGQGTKVNAVCPGNYLDGPLWTDPDNGLLVQYLAAGKVPGARTPEDVRRHYENQVPLGRGCLPEDVLLAVCYCVEQTYETGQAIPVTGGQTMLN